MVTTSARPQTGIDGAASVNSARQPGQRHLRRRQRLDRGHRQRARLAVRLRRHRPRQVLEQTRLAGPHHRRRPAPTTVISAGNYTVSNGSITVPVSSMNAANGYHLVVTPGQRPRRCPGRTRSRTGTAGWRSTPRAAVPGRARWPCRPRQREQHRRSGPWSPQAPTSTRSEQRERAAARHQHEGVGDGADALIWGDNGSADHLWQVISAGSGQYKIENYNSGLVLGVIEREHVIRRPGPAVGRQRHPRPPLDADRELIRSGPSSSDQPARGSASKWDQPLVASDCPSGGDVDQDLADLAAFYRPVRLGGVVERGSGSAAGRALRRSAGSPSR